MGCVGSRKLKETKIKPKNVKNEVFESQYPPEERNVKLLLLGAGESGKSTILKQIKIIYENGFGEQERKAMRQIVFANTIQSLNTILKAMNKLHIPFTRITEGELNEFQEFINNLDRDKFPRKLATLMKYIWNDEGVQECFNRSSEYYLNDSAIYYLNNLERISLPHYVPTQNDVLRVRTKTTGMVETHFHNDGLDYTIVDVGGQRSERKKWVSAFEGATAIIFCVALSEYDMRLEEDDEINRLSESLMLFQSICNNKLFRHIPIILFLNKDDIFKKKIATTPLSVAFPDYRGPNTYESAAAYIKLQFESVNTNKNKEIYVQFTNATDTENINFVFECVKEILLAHNFGNIFMT